MLEALTHAEKSFVTLTYSDENNDRDLHPEHLQGWLKRLRRRFPPKSIRFFAVGEYGDKSERPHYHVALFGFGSCVGGAIRDGACQCSQCSVVRETWGFGHVLVGTLEEASAQYLCGYVVKKMTRPDDIRLRGRHAEFARMSLRPYGIGAPAMAMIVGALKRYGREEFVPSQLRQGKKLMPLGRYLRDKIFEGLEYDEDRRSAAGEKALSAAYEELQLVRSVAFQTEKTVREVFREMNEPFSRQLEARQNMKARSL